MLESQTRTAAPLVRGSGYEIKTASNNFQGRPAFVGFVRQ